jgi:hypothetical protein
VENNKNDKLKFQNEIESFKKEHPDVELADITPGKEEGQYNFIFKSKGLPFLPAANQPSFSKLPADLRQKLSTRASTAYRDMLYKSDLHLAPIDPSSESPAALYAKVKAYYRSKDVFGSYVDIIVNLAMSGFENDCEDAKIKEFFDNWAEDIDITKILEWVFFELVTTGFVRTYKVVGPYTPGVNSLRKMPSPPTPVNTAKGKREGAERKKRWSANYVPIWYTVFNPTEIILKGIPEFGIVRTFLKPNDQLSELVRKEQIKTLTPAEQKIVDGIPTEFKKSILAGEEIELDPDLIGEVDYKKQPYELYPIPKGTRAMDAMDLKDAFKHADWSTIDGITSEILVITIGDKENPVLTEEELQAVSDLFNTPQKAYSVVWNHTLQVNRVPVENADQIFGSSKFEQVERDISGSFSVPRAIVDGVMYGNISDSALTLASQALVAEIEYIRSQVKRWIYTEYKPIAETFGFNRYPAVRWNTMILKDEIKMKALIQGLVDRRIMSYDTALKLLDLDPGYEKKMLTQEAPYVQKGDYGVSGSPYQKNAGDSSPIQPTQRTPKGTPSEGRPQNEPAPKTPEKKAASLAPEVIEFVQGLTAREIRMMKALLEMAERRQGSELINLENKEE